MPDLSVDRCSAALDDRTSFRFCVSRPLPAEEKREIKELKVEKIESDGVFEQQPIGPDPRIEQVIRAVSGMSAKVDQLADQVDALKKSRG